jgi:hypothetical protein
MVGRDSQFLFAKVAGCPPSEHTPVGGYVHMQPGIVQTIFRRVQISRAEGIMLDAILSKANIYGKYAKVAYHALAGITGFSERHVRRLVKSLECNRRLIRVDRRRICPGHNAINVYHVIVPWRQQVSWEEMGIGRHQDRFTYQKSGQYRPNNKGDRPCPPTSIPIPRPLPTPVSEQEASRWWTPHTPQWYFAQELEPPGKEEETALKG